MLSAHVNNYLPLCKHGGTGHSWHHKYPFCLNIVSILFCLNTAIVKGRRLSILQNANKYFELKNSWGYRPNSNYLPAFIMLGESTTHVQNTHQLHSVQTHQTCACSCVCTCTHSHTAHHTTHTYTHTHAHTHARAHARAHARTHTHTVYAQQLYTQDRHTASTDCHSYHRQRNYA